MKKLGKAVMAVGLICALAGCKGENGSDAALEDAKQAGFELGYAAGYEAAHATPNPTPTPVESTPDPTPTPASDPSAPEWEEAGFVEVGQVVEDVILEMRYYSTYNFVGRRVTGYEAPVALLTREAASALKEAAEAFQAQGYRLKIFDAYRPQRAVDCFVEWASEEETTEMKEYFYPRVEKSQLLGRYIATKSGHSRGSTVDVTLVDMKSGRELDMGGGFDLFDERSFSAYTQDLTQEQKDNRAILRRGMIEHGFQGIQSEWWHFTLKDEPYPDTYFDFPVEGRK